MLFLVKTLFCLLQETLLCFIKLLPILPYKKSDFGLLPAKAETKKLSQMRPK